MQNHKLEDYLVASLLDFFRVIDNEDKWFLAGRIALNQLARISQRPPAHLEKRVIFFASKLKGNITPSSIRAFAGECVQLLHKVEEAPKKDLNSMRTSDLKKKAMAHLSAHIKNGATENEALVRTAQTFALERKRQENLARVKNLATTHPLAQAFAALSSEKKPLPKEDIRSHLLQLPRKLAPSRQGEGVLFGLLKKASSFSAVNILELLGDDLFFLCRPAGFLDRQESILVVEVPSAAHLHALSFRKGEILNRMKQNPSFKNLKNLKMKVLGSRF